MTWIQRYRLRHYLKSSMVIIPLAMGILATVAIRVVWQIDLATGWSGLAYTPDGARGISGAVTASMLTFIVFFLSILFLSIQLAATQLTPRVATEIFSRRLGKISLGIFVFTFFFSVGLQGRSVDPVPQIAVLVLIFLTFLCICVFLFLMGHLANSLRPISIVTRVGAEGVRAIEDVYSEPLTGSEETDVNDAFLHGAKPSALIPYRGKAGVFLAFDRRGLAELAQNNRCLIRLVPQVGRFLGTGDPLFQVYGPSQDLGGHDLHQFVAVGPERTIEQDPAFAFRIIVDVAIRALSPAINDPTTAVQCIDQIHRLLPIVGKKDLGDGRIRDRDGELRLIFPTANWEDFVRLGVSEIRMYGGGSMQIMRRLRAMLENLIDNLPPRRHQSLLEQLRLLDGEVERNFREPEDRKAAGLADYGGIGGVIVRRSDKD